MRIIDAHVHLYEESGYVDLLLRTMDDCGIERCCLSGLGPLFGFADDAAVQQAFQAHPDRIVGAVFLRPGRDDPEKIDRAFESGFRMVKVTLPSGGYDDPAYFPLWQRVYRHQMPVLFHTGTVATKGEWPGERISSWNMHPMRIEPISREFPDLKIILAHLGVHWNADAAELARMRPNVYVDLTGEPGGWRMRADREGMERYLWWPGAFNKVVFGTDVHRDKMKQILREDLSRMERLGLGEATRERMLSKNILELLNEG